MYVGRRHRGSVLLTLICPLQVVNYKDDIIIPDQGSNEVWILKYDSAKGFTLAGTIGNFEPEDGPRHVAMHPSG